MRNGHLLLTCLFFSLAVGTSLAHSYGPAPRVTGAPGDNPKACTSCHTGTALNGGAGAVTITLQSGAVYIPGVKQRITVTVADTGQQRWGFELSARLNSDLANNQAGDLLPVDTFTQVICEDAAPKPCLTGVQFIQHTTLGTRNGTKDTASFQFDWMPPATNAGPVTLYVAGNAANGDSNLTGDHIYTSSVQLTPVAPQPPAISANGVVSAASATASAVAANSWITIYGTNLAATTRAWQPSDFVNGAFPTTLDGVSVVLTAFGAPRRAYLGYVSPTQLNVLLPSDTNATTVQVQVKNPAGISAQLPITVAANTPQLLTIDGKHVFALHADGTVVGPPGLSSAFTSSPAARGESITVLAAGCGVTNPAQINGVVPSQASVLVSLPVFTVAGVSAAVSSGTIAVGLGGVYQITIQVPANASTGDQPIAASQASGTASSALITVR